MEKAGTHEVHPKPSLTLPLSIGMLGDARMGNEWLEEGKCHWRADKLFSSHSQNILNFADVVNANQGLGEGAKKQLNNWRPELAALLDDEFRRILRSIERMQEVRHVAHDTLCRSFVVGDASIRLGIGAAIQPYGEGNDGAHNDINESHFEDEGMQKCCLR